VTDLSIPSFAAAYALARNHAARGDRDGATALFCRLLWHVEASEGGFIGLSDEELLEKCEADKRLNHAIATAALYAPEPWPVIKDEHEPQKFAPYPAVNHRQDYPRQRAARRTGE